MYRILPFLCLSLCFVFTVTAQVPDRLLVAKYTSSTDSTPVEFDSLMRTYYDYVESGALGAVTTYGRFNVTGWGGNRNVVFYDENGREIKHEYYSDNYIGDWKIYLKDTITYGSNWVKLERKKPDNGVWRTTTIDTKYRNRFGLDSAREVTTINNGTPTTSELQYVYLLNSANKPILVTYQHWDAGLSQWTDITIDSFVYTNSLITQGFHSQLAGDKMARSYRYEKNYRDGHVNDSTIYFYRTDSMKYIPNVKMVYTYTNGNLSTVQKMDVVNGSWKTTETQYYTYDSENYLVRKLLYEPYNGDGITQKDTFIYAPSSILSVRPVPVPEVKLYPVPARERLFVKLEKTTGSVGINVVDVSGRITLRTTAEAAMPGTQGIDVSSLKPGIYLLQIQGVNYSITRQFTKM